MVKFGGAALFNRRTTQCHPPHFSTAVYNRGQIRTRLCVSLRNIIDLDHVFRKQGYTKQIGVRAAVGVVLKQNFAKSKSVTTSNWAAVDLTPRQLLYAANDAFAALRVMEALNLSDAKVADDVSKHV